MSKRFDWDDVFDKIPRLGQDTLKNYFLHAYQPGGFMTSLLCNDPWTDVISRADNWNRPILGQYLEFLHEHAPEGSWGSEANVRDWLAKGPAYQACQKSLTWEALKADHTETKEHEW